MSLEENLPWDEQSAWTPEDWDRWSSKKATEEKKIVATYDYQNANGTLRYQVVRLLPKDFRVRRMEKGEWVWNLQGVDRILYHLPFLMDQERQEELIYIVEGEKDADLLSAAWGLLSTTNVGGAGKWRLEYSQTLQNRAVAILPDQDEPGQAHARDVASSLRSHGCDVTIVNLPNLPPKGDVSDWVGKPTPQKLRELSRIVDEAQHTARMKWVDLKSAPPPQDWIVPHWIARGDIIVFAGRAGSGKSTTVAELAVAVAGGRNGRGWLGVEPVGCHNVLYLDEEAGTDEIHRLFARLGAAGDKALPSLFVSSCQGLTLSEPGFLTQLEREIIEKSASMVILDTASHFFSGADENNAREIRHLFESMIYLREKYKTVFVVVHHYNKPNEKGQQDPLDRVRGSTAFTTQSSAVWIAVPVVGASSAIDLSVIKRRGGGKKHSIRIEYSEIDGEIILSSLGEPESVETTLDTVSRFIVGLYSEEKNLRRKPIVEAAQSQGYPRSAVDRALKHLVALGTLSIPSRGTYQISPEERETIPIFSQDT